MHCIPPSIWQFLWVCYCKFYCLTRIYMYFHDISLHDMFTIFDFLSILLTKTKGMWEKASKQYIDYKNFTHPASARLEFFDPPQDIDISFFRDELETQGLLIENNDSQPFDWCSSSKLAIKSIEMWNVIIKNHNVKSIKRKDSRSIHKAWKKHGCWNIFKY